MCNFYIVYGQPSCVVLRKLARICLCNEHCLRDVARPHRYFISFFHSVLSFCCCSLLSNVTRDSCRVFKPAFIVRARCRARSVCSLLACRRLAERLIIFQFFLFLFGRHLRAPVVNFYSYALLHNEKSLTMQSISARECLSFI